MSVQGLKQIVEALGTRHQQATAKGLRVGLLRAGLFLQRESQKIVPIDTSALKGSAQTVLTGEGFDVAVEVSYGGTGAGPGGEDVGYAVYVHENLEAKHAPGKSAKFLSIPLTEKKDAMSKLVIEGIEENQI